MAGNSTSYYVAKELIHFETIDTVGIGVWRISCVKLQDRMKWIIKFGIADYL